LLTEFRTFYNMLYDICKKNKVFLIPYIGFLLIVFPVMILLPKAEIHLFINGYYSSFCDFFFRYITLLGSGAAPFIIGVVFLFYSLRNAFFIAASASLAGVLAQVLKRMVFFDAARPLSYFRDIAELHIVKGVDMYCSHSFPSGHSATIFALCFALALLTNNNLIKFSLFLLAFVVAFSRVYLSQHFLNDIYAGSIIGMACVPVTKIVFDRIKASWIDKSLQAIIKPSREKAK
jgi:membrane-associated phospholipid phosphatase